MYVYLKVSYTHIQSKRGEKGDLPSSGLLSKWLQQPVLGQNQTRNPEFRLLFYVGRRASSVASSGVLAGNWCGRGGAGTTAHIRCGRCRVSQAHHHVGPWYNILWNATKQEVLQRFTEDAFYEKNTDFDISFAPKHNYLLIPFVHILLRPPSTMFCFPVYDGS